MSSACHVLRCEDDEVNDFKISYLIALKAKMTTIDINPDFPSWKSVQTSGNRASSDSTYEPSRSNLPGDEWKDGFKITRANQIIAGSNTSYYVGSNSWSSSSMSVLKSGMVEKAQNGQYMYQPFQMPTSSLAYTSTSDNWPESGDLWVTGHKGLLSGFEYNAWTAESNNLDCQFDNQWHLIWRDKNVKNTKITPGLDGGCYVNRNTSNYEFGAVPKLRSERKFYDKAKTDPIEYDIRRIEYPSLNREDTRYRLYASPRKCWFHSLPALKDKPLIQLISSENPVYTALTAKENSWTNLMAHDTFKHKYITEASKDCNTFLMDVKKTSNKVQVPMLSIPKLNPASYQIPSEINTTIPYNHVPNYYEHLKNKLDANAVLEPMMRVVKTSSNVVNYYSYNDVNLSEFSKTGAISGLPIPSAKDMKIEQLNFIDKFNELVHSLYKNGVKGSIAAFRRLFGTVVNGKLTKLNSIMAGSFAIPSFVNAILKQGNSPYNASSNTGYISNGIPFVGAGQGCGDSNELKISSNITFAKVLKPDVYNYPQNAYSGNLPTTLDYYDSSNGKTLLIKNQSGTGLIKDLLPEHEITMVRKEEQMASRMALVKDNEDHNPKTYKIPFVYNIYLANSSDCTIYRDAFLSGVKMEENINPCCCNLGNTRINQCGMEQTSVVNAAMVSFPYFYFKINIADIIAKVKKELYDTSNLIPSSSGSHDITKSPKIMLSFMTRSDGNGLSNPKDLIEYDAQYTDQVKPTKYARDLRLIRNDDFTTKGMHIYSVMQDLRPNQTCYSITYQN